MYLRKRGVLLTTAAVVQQLASGSAMYFGGCGVLLVVSIWDDCRKLQPDVVGVRAVTFLEWRGVVVVPWLLVDMRIDPAQLPTRLLAQKPTGRPGGTTLVPTQQTSHVRILGIARCIGRNDAQPGAHWHPHTEETCQHGHTGMGCDVLEGCR